MTVFQLKLVLYSLLKMRAIGINRRRFVLTRSTVTHRRPVSHSKLLLVTLTRLMSCWSRPRESIGEMPRKVKGLNLTKKYQNNGEPTHEPQTYYL